VSEAELRAWADRMADWANNEPGFPSGLKIIILLDAEDGGGTEGAVAAAGYNDPGEILVSLLSHVESVAGDAGLRMKVMPLGLN
jgi:hypothetical protein